MEVCRAMNQAAALPNGDRKRLSRPALAMLATFCAVLLGVAALAVVGRVSTLVARNTAQAPARQVGTLTVHGPMTVRGQLAVSGDIKVHGPVTALRVRHVSRASLRSQEKTEPSEPTMMNGPMTVGRSLTVNGDLRVDGPLKVIGEILSPGGVTADGPLVERAGQ
jgi:cytoskeletal protein CcmA (bactofilin family)